MSKNRANQIISEFPKIIIYKTQVKLHYSHDSNQVQRKYLKIKLELLNEQNKTHNYSVHDKQNLKGPNGSNFHQQTSAFFFIAN